MAEWDWAKIAVDAGISFVSGATGLLIGVWRWGRNSAEQEQAVKDDYTMKIEALRDEMRASMNSYEKGASSRNDLLVAQFRESFEGIRRQIDKIQLDTEKDFMRKEDFKDFREEYREDMRNLKMSIAEIAKPRH